jgi:hypothetical protein
MLAGLTLLGISTAVVIFVAIFGLFPASIEVCYDLEDYCLN